MGMPVTVNEGRTNRDQMTNIEEEQAPELATYPRKYGFLWGSAEKIDGCINPKQHVDWV
jgi:hypothetical protein